MLNNLSSDDHVKNNAPLLDQSFGQSICPSTCYASSQHPLWAFFLNAKATGQTCPMYSFIDQSAQSLAFSILEMFNHTCLSLIPSTSIKRSSSPIKLCPIPARPPHLLKRGFSTQHLLADRIAHYLNSSPLMTHVIYDPHSLIRVIDTPSQTGSSRKDRLVQQQNSLSYQGSSYDQVIIIDDVLTTGSTLKEAYRALAQAGTKPLASCFLFIAQDGR